MAIEFYSVGDEYGCFSNFSPHPFRLDGKRWPTSEHYFQAQKFAGTPHAEEVRKARSPMTAARLGRSRKAPLRRDWDGVKEQVMRKAVLAKFEAHADIREVLLGTGDEKIVEATTDDYYWGSGAAGSGKNRLGQILMEVRAILRQAGGPSATREAARNSMKSLPPVETVAQGKFVRLVKRGKWEYASRTKVTGIVGVVAVTDDGKLILIEQDRPAIGKRCIEIPAGLAGDETGMETEELAEAAKRELLEETGYAATGMERLTEGPPSAGITDEVITLFRATGLTRTGNAGGVGGEEIILHEVPLADVPAWLEARAKEGLAIDLKVYAAMYFATR